MAELRRRGIGYVVVSGAVADRVEAAAEDYPDEARFYADLERSATQVYRRAPGDGSPGLGGIYRLD